MRRTLAATLLCVALTPAPASAHPLAPVLLELFEQEGGVVEVAWRRPLREPVSIVREPVLPPSCRRAETLESVVGELSLTERWRMTCEGGLVGQPVSVTGLAASGTDALVRITLGDGRVIQRVLRPTESGFVVPARTPALEVARDYGVLGFEHLASGIDHLLFVLGLWLLVGSGMRLVRTVTAFTVGHSVTLALATLGIVRFPSGPIELLIAASVFWLAVELARGEAERPSWLRRAPWRMAGAFGLLHGLGFAGALAETGLPESEIPLALLSFNLGIEAGQLAFVGVLASGAWLWTQGRAALRPARVAPAHRLARVPVYAMGSVSAFWCLERASQLWP